MRFVFALGNAVPQCSTLSNIHANSGRSSSSGSKQSHLHFEGRILVIGGLFPTADRMWSYAARLLPFACVQCARWPHCLRLHRHQSVGALVVSPSLPLSFDLVGRCWSLSLSLSSLCGRRGRWLAHSFVRPFIHPFIHHSSHPSSIHSSIHFFIHPLTRENVLANIAKLQCARRARPPRRATARHTTMRTTHSTTCA